MTALWNDVVALYAAPGIRELCLELQDRDGTDVPLLLSVASLAARGVAFDEVKVRQLERVCEPWQRRVVAPLRAARRALRPEEAAGTGLDIDPTDRAELKRCVQEAELAAERLQIEAIAAAARAWVFGHELPSSFVAVDSVLRRVAAGANGAETDLLARSAIALPQSGAARSTPCSPPGS
ncbi:MAG: TIGR02444 family protein [Pseudomonadota bacterium]